MLGTYNQNNLSDHPGRDFTPSALVRTDTKGPPGGRGEERKRRSTDANDAGMEYRRGVGSTRVCNGRGVLGGAFREVLGEAIKKRKRAICWFRVVEETTEVLRERDYCSIGGFD